MPWMETSPVEQRERFIRDHWLAPYTMAELCAGTASVGRRATNGSSASRRRAGRACGTGAERRIDAPTALPVRLRP